MCILPSRTGLVDPACMSIIGDHKVLIGKSDSGVLSATSTTIQSGALALKVGRFGPGLKTPDPEGHFDHSRKWPPGPQGPPVVRS